MIYYLIGNIVTKNKIPATTKTRKNNAKKSTLKQGFFIQIGAYQNKRYANKAKNKAKQFGSVIILEKNKNGKKISQILIGPFTNKISANKVRNKENFVKILGKNNFIKELK